MATYGYCGKLQRSSNPGGITSFDDIGYLTEVVFPKITREEIDLTDSGACSMEGGYRRTMPSPLRSIEAITVTVIYDTNNLNHLKIQDDFNTNHAPDSAYVWQWMLPDTSIAWRCKAWVSDVQEIGEKDGALQLTFTLTFTGKPYSINHTSL